MSEVSQRNLTEKPEETDQIKQKLEERWNVTGRQILLHNLNNLRVPFIVGSLITTHKVKTTLINTTKVLEGTVILDVSCGGGILTESLAKLGGRVHGIDPSSDVISAAKRHAQLDKSLSNLEYFTSTVEDYAEKNVEIYDAVIASDVLECVVEKEAFLEACLRCLKPEGSLIITTFNKTWMSWIQNVIIGQGILNIIPRGTRKWDQLIRPEDTQEILNKHNCRTVEIRGINLNWMKKKWSWTLNNNHIYALHAIKNR
ncbi:hypothetical protein PPYR_00806 [Photinus pyralis]|uniref:Methyltransferase type 11 domain-containing protein n=1 Tax=Photinus pyralis TaxID=7054 RepID=A0A1Y1JQW1_PHOPY|nr:ubiquinone biosynthesis O-methyltransferase, mitochondrial-like [Photinus pyralis]XP_031327353.1 ubiquinone biosynthesis O-methyltransferase, mitochondrial-like [Photinus pyralis]KAB0803836.1 hypothetical protein PPYR_00806 [Photinus pyralis]